MNGIESQLGETIEVIRLNLLSSIGREAAAKFGVRIVPATIIVDGKGTVLARQFGMPGRVWLEDYMQRIDQAGTRLVLDQDNGDSPSERSLQTPSNTRPAS